MDAILKRIRANWIKRGCVLALVAGIAVGTAISNCGISTSAGEDYAYVACRDKRIYVVDVARNKVVQTSGVFETMGGPTSIDLDSQHKILYVASDRGFWQERYSPILAIDISEWPLKIVRSYELVVGPSEGPFADISAVYTIVVSPDGKKLYAGYAREGFADGSTIVDAQTGKIIGQLNNLYVDPNSLFSPGGDKLAHMWSHDTRTAEARARITQSAAVVIYDLVQNKEISRTYPVEGKIALQPPWGKIEWAFVGLADRGVINLFDRNSGALLSSIDVNKMTGLHSASRYATLFDDGNKIILPMVSYENKGFVVAVDVVKGEVIQKTEVGEYPTNVIISGFLPSGKNIFGALLIAALGLGLLWLGSRMMRGVRFVFRLLFEKVRNWRKKAPVPAQ